MAHFSVLIQTNSTLLFLRTHFLVNASSDPPTKCSIILSPFRLSSTYCRRGASTLWQTSRRPRSLSALRSGLKQFSNLFSQKIEFLSLEFITRDQSSAETRPRSPRNDSAQRLQENSDSFVCSIMNGLKSFRIELFWGVSVLNQLFANL